MEPEALELLKKVSKSIFLAVLWLGVNSIAAIKGDHAFIKNAWTLGNIVFYIWLVISILILVLLLNKIWAPKANQSA